VGVRRNTMGTRCQVQLHDTDEKDSFGAMLYHHMDGYPDFMGPYLVKMLEAVREFIDRTGFAWWDSERVAAVMVLLSSTHYDEPGFPDESRIAPDRKTMLMAEVGKYDFDGGVPHFQPSQTIHGDIEYMWHVYLSAEGAFRITYDDLDARESVDYTTGTVVSTR
jgi:hypothetical protein